MTSVSASTGAVDYQLVLETFSDAVVAAGEDNRIVFTNRSTEALLGWSSAELIGRPLTTIIPSRFRHAHLLGFTRYLDTQDPVLVGRPIRVPALRQDGSELEVELTISVARAAVDSLLFVGSLRDVRDLVALERETEVSRRLLSVIAEATSLGMTAPRVLAALGETLSWDVTAFWVPDRTGERLRCMDLWHSAEVAIPSFERRTRQMPLSMGEGLPGMVWQTRDPLWLPDVTETDNFPRSKAARADGLHGAFAFPITNGDRFLGVIEHFSRDARTPDTQVLSTMATLAGPIGQFIERRMVSEELEASQLRLALALDAAGMGTWEWSVATDALRLSEGAEAILGLAPGTGDAYLAHVHPADRQLVGDALRRAVTDGEEYHVEHRVTYPDGSIHWAENKGRVVADFAGVVVGMAGVLMDITARKEGEQERERLQRDRLRAAEVLQHSLLPPHLPAIPGIEVASRYRPAGHGDVGGDFYDLFPVHGSSWGIAMGDVQGKGPEAAAVTAMVRYTLRASAMQARRPDRVLAQLNTAMLMEPHSHESRFCTIVFARLQPGADGALVTLANGGHPQPFVLRNDGRVEPLGGEGMIVGAFRDAGFSAHKSRLAPGEAVVFYTDGVTEARTSDGLFGDERLRAVLDGCAGAAAEAIAERVESAVLEHDPSPRDDLAIVVLRVADKG